MQADVGDELMVHGRYFDGHERTGVIIAVRGENGSPPYLVRWLDGRESVFPPSQDTLVAYLPGNPQDSPASGQ